MAASSQTVVCVKQVKQVVAEEWEEHMPLPGDIIEGVAEIDADDSFVSARARSELNLHLGKINRVTESVWLKVRRGQGTVKLRVCVIPDRNVKLQKRFTVRAASDERHIAVLADMTYEECFELQVISSILFMPQAREKITDPITVRAMAWFSAAISSGIPLIFVNIQTEEVITSDRNILLKERNHATGREAVNNMIVNIGKVARGTAAERAGLGELFEEASRTEHLLVISRLQGKSLMPSTVDSEGLIQCCDNQDIKEALFSAMERTDSIRLHIMSWPNRMAASVSPRSVAATLQPPN